jgi:eukaryotic-like serine/threonine-protein kinase
MLQELRPGDPRLIGPYRLVGHLGDGGMGRVYLGRSPGGRAVAVKVIRSELAADPDFRVRFRREVAAARKVNGLFTAMVVDADVDAAEPWLATAYVDGPALSEAVHDHGPLPASSVLALAGGLAESLDAIHGAHVVHRDLKPSNVLLAEDGPRVIDFGISRAAEATSVTRAGFVIGSPGFMSPEQAEGGVVGPASDVFSLGAVLVFAATGQSPFGSGMTAALVYRVVHAPPQTDGVPEQIRPLVEQCLAKDPGQRPAVSDLLDQLGTFQSMTGWLPVPILGARAGRPAQPSAEPTPPPGAESGKATEPPAVSPGTTSSAVERVPLIAAATEAGTGAEADTGPLADGPADQGHQTVTPEGDALTPEVDLLTPVPGPGPDESGDLMAPVLALPTADAQQRRRRHLSRPLLVGAAAALLLIASATTGLALSSSSGHASASAKRTAAAVIPSPQAGSSAASAVGTPPGSSVSGVRATPHPTHRPSPHPTTAAATTQAPAAQPTPTLTRTTAPQPTHTPRPKPTPTRTHTTAPKTLTFSVSGASEGSCGEVGSVQSSDGSAVSFNFSDQSSVQVEIAAISTSGAVQWEATLGPGLVYGAPTSVGAYWVVENSGGGCLAVFKVDGGGQVTVN